jgi:hypothetical protein
MDDVRRDPEAGGRGRQAAIRERGRAPWTECCPGGGAGRRFVRERGLRRVPQAEHGEPAVARDEADSEHPLDRVDKPARAEAGSGRRGCVEPFGGLPVPRGLMR